MRAWLLIATALLGGCLDPRTTTCGDLVCPVGKQCDPTGTTCVFPEQLTGCEGAVDGTTCSYPEVSDGICRGGVCGAPYCGDAISSGSELCDDGNAVGGDGCSADCLSDERCGNGVVDLSVGEECDDANLRSHDGCSSGCLVEQPSWSEREISHLGGFWFQMVYDAAHERMVAVLGTTPTLALRAYTVIHDGRTWNVRQTSMSPRMRHVSVYDARRRVVVTFGGSAPIPGGDIMVLDDTWEYDGDSAAERTPTETPPGRHGAAAAYDAARGQMVVFGGIDQTGAALSDTWAYDGATWTNVTPPSSPPARSDHLMAYDSARERVVMFGGIGLTDTWEWDGTGWTETTPAAVPNARGAMAYDARRARTVLFGGDRDPQGTPGDHTWEYDGASWIDTTPAVSPPSRVNPNLAYDPVRERIVLLGGGFGNIGATYTDVWEYDGTSWSEVPILDQPERRNHHGLVYDEWRSGVLLAGGAVPPGAYYPETWTYDGMQQWRLLDTDGMPPAPNPPGGMGLPPWPYHMVYDSARGRSLIVLNGPGGVDTWSFDGMNWRRIETLNRPPGRVFAALAYDVARDRLVLFGGEMGPANLLGDTWELDGSTWVQATPVASPSPRSDVAVAYDHVRGQVVIFGGRDGAARLDETWAYDGSTWTEIPSASRPAPRSGAAMTYDPARGSMVMVMGEDGPMPRPDTWELRNGEWTQLAVETPRPRKATRIVYHRSQRAVFLHGGDPEADTWFLRFGSATPDELCEGGDDEDGDGLVDCADPDCDGATCGPGNLACVAATCTCRVSAEMQCGDQFDDDCDGLVDCADPDCAAGAWCAAEPSCTDGTDEDEDGLIDCADPGCVGVGVCTVFEDDCSDTQDNDGDGATDCADPDCFLDPCPALVP